MNIVLLEPIGVSESEMLDFSSKIESQGHTFKAYPKSLDVDVLKEEVKDADVIIIANMPLKGEVIRSAKNLKFINVAFTGVDHVDLEAAKECNVKVSNASGYSNQSVAELTICMMLELLRNVSQTEEKCRLGLTKDGLVGYELSGKTVGIIGVGNIGLKVAHLLNAFGCKVLGHRRNPGSEQFIEYVSLEDLLKRSDIVTLHCPGGAATLNLIDKEKLAMMKNSAYLINAARGTVVNQNDLADALNNDVIAGAAIDVFDIEPPLATDHVLLQAKNTRVTPHIAFATKESMILRKNIVLNNFLEWEKGNQINIIL